MTSSLPASALHALALIAKSSSSLPLRSIEVDADGALHVNDPGPPAAFSFMFDGVNVSARIRPTAEGYIVDLAAQLGPVPYSTESREVRIELLHIAMNLREMGYPRFLIDRHQVMWLTTHLHRDERPTVDSVFYEIVLFLGRARPVIQLVRPLMPGATEPSDGFDDTDFSFG